MVAAGGGGGDMDMDILMQVRGIVECSNSLGASSLYLHYSS